MTNVLRTGGLVAASSSLSNSPKVNASWGAATGLSAVVLVVI